MRFITSADNGDSIILTSDVERVFGFDLSEIYSFIDAGILPPVTSIPVFGWRHRNLMMRLYEIKDARKKSS